GRSRCGGKVTIRFCPAIFRGFTPVIRNSRPSSATNRNIPTSAIIEENGRPHLSLQTDLSPVTTRGQAGSLSAITAGTAVFLFVIAAIALMLAPAWATPLDNFFASRPLANHTAAESAS